MLVWMPAKAYTPKAAVIDCACIQHWLNVQSGLHRSPTMHTHLRQNYVPKPDRAPVWLRRIWGWL